MHLPARRRGAVSLTLAGLATAVAVTAPAAQASDAGLKKTVLRYEQRTTPLAKAFAAADKALAAAPNTDTASAATGKLRDGLHAYKQAVVPIKTQTTRAAAGKKELLTGIREFDLGLVQYQKLLDKVNAGADKASLKATFVTLNKRIDAAGKDEHTALVELGLVKK